jgi:hypothetical protein
MTAPRDQYYPGEDGQGRYPALEAMDRDLERLGALTRAYVTDEKEDLGVAAARIPDKELRREAEDLLSRLKEAIGPGPDAISETLAEPGAGPHPVLTPRASCRRPAGGQIAQQLPVGRSSRGPACFAAVAGVIVDRQLPASPPSRPQQAHVRGPGTAAPLMDARRNR